jgi:hypothetical protein
VVPFIETKAGRVLNKQLKTLEREGVAQVRAGRMRMAYRARFRGQLPYSTQAKAVRTDNVHVAIINFDDQQLDNHPIECIGTGKSLKLEA